MRVQIKVQWPISREALRTEIELSKAKGELTDMAVAMLLKMIDKVQSKFKYTDEHLRQDCRAAAVEQVLKKWSKADPDLGDLFSFYTQMIKNGLYAGWNESKKYKADFSTSEIFSEDI